MRRFIAGIDEVGRGPLAGPVTAACVVLDAGCLAGEVADSKKLSPKRREQLSKLIEREAIACSVVCVGPRRIDMLNIREASRLAMRLAVERVLLQLQKAYGRCELELLIDGNVPIETSLPQKTIIKGDETVAVISAASIVAKVRRDSLMGVLDKKYHGYGLAGHKGYPTKIHKELLSSLGPSPVHRRSFRGVREYL